MRTVLWLLLGIVWARAGAQAATATAVLSEMGSAAGVIFSGSVEAVTPGAGYVDVRFRVEHGVRGSADGGQYVLREWSGLWSGGAQRYRVGERALVLLHARGSSGMSSPVGGLDGVVPLFAGADGVERVDLRWVRARAVRGSAAIPDGGVGDGGQVHADPADPDWPGPVLPLPTGGPGAPEPDLASVLEMLGAP